MVSHIRLLFFSVSVVLLWCVFVQLFSMLLADDSMLTRLSELVLADMPEEARVRLTGHEAIKFKVCSSLVTS